MQVLARPDKGASAEALSEYSVEVLKGLYAAEIVKQLGMGR